MQDKIETAVFIFGGFLDAGKTSALQGAVLQARAGSDGKAVIICTEEGETDYRRDLLKEFNIEVVDVDSEEEFNTEFLDEVHRQHHPEVVYIEFNGMWDLRDFLNMPLPPGWFVANVFTMVNATTYNMYLRNMCQTMLIPISVADVIFFNRCDDSFDKGKVWRELKILNSRAEIFFVRPDGTVDRELDNITPPIVDGVMQIGEEIYCPWFVDCIENPEKYLGKTVKFKGMVFKDNSISENQFYFGRYATVCCEADSKFLGFVSAYADEPFEHGDWLEAKAVIEFGEIFDLKKIITLNIQSFEKVEKPEDPYLFF